MSDLAEFLLARIAEDETDARSAVGSDGTTTQHVARWNPARVLAECGAKRRIIAAHQTYGEVYDAADMTYPHAAGSCVTCGFGDTWEAVEYGSGDDYPCPTLRFLAAPYSDHPDFDEAWRVGP